jgi:MFS family permease
LNFKEKIFALKISSIMATRMLGLFMIFPVFSLLADKYDESTPILIGLALGIYGFTQAILQIPFGYLSDRYGRKPILFGGILLFIIGSIMATMATDIHTIIIARALQGSGAISAVLMAFLADFVREDHRTSANAFVGVQIGLAFMLAIIIGPIISTMYGIDGLFLAISILAGIGMLILLSLPHAKPTTLYPFSRVHFADVITKKLVKLDLYMFSLHYILASTFVVFPLLLAQNNIISIADSWMLYLPVMSISFIIMIPLIILAHKEGRSDIMLKINIGIILFSQFLFAIVESQEYSFNIYVIGAMLTVFFSAFNALEATLPSLISKNAPGEKRGLAMGVFTTSQFLGAFAGGILGGTIYSYWGIGMVFFSTAAIGTALLIPRKSLK